MFTQRIAARAVLTFAPLLLVGVLAGCGGSPSGPQVANLGAGASTTTAAPSTSSDPYAQALAYSQCMRSHGVPNFPDPQKSGGPGGSGGAVRIQVGGNGINPQSPQFQAAQRACQSLRPGAGKADTPADPTKLQPWADCVRKHGVPNLPDPTIVNGNVQIDLSGTGIDPSSPQAQQAIQACKSLSPGGRFQLKANNGAVGGGK